MPKKEIDPIEAVRILALWNVSRPAGKENPEYLYREMARWYSETFNYKLHEVDDIDIETIATHYYEHFYGEMTPEQRDEEVKKLLLTEEEQQKAQEADDKFLADVMREAAEQASKLRTTASALKEAVQGLQTPEKAALDELKTAVQKPEIEMKFISEEEMEEAMEWDLFGKPTKG